VAEDATSAESLRERIARAIIDAAPPAPRVILTDADVKQQAQRSAYFAAAQVARTADV